MLYIKDLKKSVLEKIIFTEFSTQLSNGLHLLLGHNGVGKTTLLRVLAGAIAADKGQIRLNTADLAADPIGYKLQIGYVPQKFGVYTELNARQFLLYLAELKGVPLQDRAQRVAEIMELTRLEDRQHKTLATWTSGMQQKLIIAQGLLNDPQLLLLDEPMSGLDTNERIYFSELFWQLAQSRIVLLGTQFLDDFSEADTIFHFIDQHLQSWPSMDEFCGSAAGKVWNVHMSEAEWQSYKSENFFSRTEKLPDGSFSVRLIADEPLPISDIYPAVPTMEDAWLYWETREGQKDKNEY